MTSKRGPTSGGQQPGSGGPGGGVGWFGEFELQALAADQGELAEAIRDFIADRHGLARHGLGRRMSVHPTTGTTHTVLLEPPTSSGAPLTARIPPGAAGRRAALTESGWAIEKTQTGTRYFTRRFDDLGHAADDTGRAIVDSYLRLYGDRAKGVSWSVRVDPLHPDTAGTVHRVLGAAQEWRVRLGETEHRIVLGTGPRAFMVDGVPHALGPGIKVGPRSVVFNLGGHKASMTWSNVTPTIGANFMRRLRTNRTLGVPLTVLVSVLFGAAAGSGAAAAGAEAMVKGWAVYDLRVNGRSQGSWVRSLGGGNAFEGWVFVRPSEALPHGDWINWPALPEPSAAEVARNRRVGLFLKAMLLVILALFVLGMLFLPGGLLDALPA